jgi:hypothetical protein
LFLVVDDRTDLIRLKLCDGDSIDSSIVEAATRAGGFLEPAMNGIPGDLLYPSNRAGSQSKLGLPQRFSRSLLIALQLFADSCARGFDLETKLHSLKTNGLRPLSIYGHGRNSKPRCSAASRVPLLRSAVAPPLTPPERRPGTGPMRPSPAPLRGFAGS